MAATPTKTPATISTALVRAADLPINDTNELMKLADILYKGGVAPKGVGRPEALAAIILMGREVGLGHVQACQSIMYVNGRLSMWGDAMLALVRRSGLMVKFQERLEGAGDDRIAHCVVQRKGEEEKDFTFSVNDAKRAGLWDKKGPWQEYPNRQLQMRARSWALRDTFTDVLCGLAAIEEVNDFQEIGPKVTVQTPAAETPPAPAHSLPPTSSPPASFEPAAIQQPAAPSANGQHVDGELMITDEQLQALASLREPFLLRHANVSPRVNPAAYQQEWLRFLSRWKVDSAKKLTQSQATEAYELMREPSEKLNEELAKFF